MKTGIDAIAFYVPQIYVDIKDLAEARGIEPAKLKKGLGLQKMAIPNVGEDAATFSAQALLNLINDNDIDPNTIGRVYLGTESAVDGSKPTATYAVEIVENTLAKTYGDRCFKHCDILDMTFACVGAVDAMQNCLDWVKQNPNRKAVIIASDVSKYELNSTGEYTQGAGAVAVLLSHNPSILSINDTWGVGSKSEGDFFKPRRTFKKKALLEEVLNQLGIDATESKIEEFIKNSNSEFWSDNNEVVEVFKEEPVFDGQFSNACYAERITEALVHFNTQNETDFINDWSHFVFHLPYAFHGRRIIFDNWLNWLKNTATYDELESEIGSFTVAEDKKAWQKMAYKSKLYSSFISEKIATGELASSEIGNMYTASIFMSFLSILSQNFDNNIDLTGQKIGFIGYGSGSKSKVFEGVIQPEWKEKLTSVKLFKTLSERKAIAVNTYEDIHRSKLDKSIAVNNTVELDYTESEPMNYGLRRYKVNDKNN